MNKWVRRSLSAGALTASALLAGGAAAQAGPSMSTDDNIGLLNGTQLALPIQAPINVCGVAASVGGAAGAACDGGASATIDQWSFANMHSSGNLGVGNGTQLAAPIQAPINACGVAVGVLGTAAAKCDGGAHAEHQQPEYGHQPVDPYELGPALPYGGHDAGSDHGYGDHDGVYGVGPYELGLEAGFAPEESGNAGVSMVSSGNVGLLNGTQVVAPVQLPINVCGVAIGVLGTAQAACKGGSSANLGL